MVRVDNDPAYYNAIANDPKVRPWVAPDIEGPLDTSPLFARGALGLHTDHGGFVLIARRRGIYEAHALFPPQENRMARALHDTAEALEFIFTSCNARLIEAATPRTSQGVIKLLQSTGFALEHEDDDCLYYILTKAFYVSLQRQRYYDIMAAQSV